MRKRRCTHSKFVLHDVDGTEGAEPVEFSMAARGHSVSSPFRDGQAGHTRLYPFLALAPVYTHLQRSHVELR